eukprot:9892669-Alexandrium_andersonii.AAC.1
MTSTSPEELTELDAGGAALRAALPGPRTESWGCPELQLKGSPTSPFASAGHGRFALPACSGAAA